MKRFCPIVWFLLVGFLLAPLVRVMAEPRERPLWEQEVMLLYSESATEFNRLRSIGEENKRLALYTQAVDILHGRLAVDATESQPEAAGRLLEILIADGNSDAIGLASRYYHARLQKLHPETFEPGAGDQAYWQLYEDWPDRFFGQLALVRCMTSKLYVDDPEGGVAAARSRIQEMEMRIEEFAYPELKRSAHRVIAGAFQRVGEFPEAALQHYEAALALEIPVPSIRVEVLEQVAELSEAADDKRRALEAYNQILLLDPAHPEAAEMRRSAARLRSELGAVEGG